MAFGSSWASGGSGLGNIFEQSQPTQPPTTGPVFMGWDTQPVGVGGSSGNTSSSPIGIGGSSNGLSANPIFSFNPTPAPTTPAPVFTPPPAASQPVIPFSGAAKSDIGGVQNTPVTTTDRGSDEIYSRHTTNQTPTYYDINGKPWSGNVLDNAGALGYSTTAAAGYNPNGGLVSLYSSLDEVNAQKQRDAYWNAEAARTGIVAGGGRSPTNLTGVANPTTTGTGNTGNYLTMDQLQAWWNNINNNNNTGVTQALSTLFPRLNWGNFQSNERGKRYFDQTTGKYTGLGNITQQNSL